MFYWVRRRRGAAIMIAGSVVFANAFCLLCYSSRLMATHGIFDKSFVGQIHNIARSRVGLVPIADIAIGLGVLGLFIFFVGVWRATNRPANRSDA